MVVGPGAKLKGAVLLVKGEMLDFNLTGTFIDGWRKPVDGTIEKDNDISEDSDLIGSISTVVMNGEKTKKSFKLLTN